MFELMMTGVEDMYSSNPVLSNISIFSSDEEIQNNILLNTQKLDLFDNATFINTELSTKHDPFENVQSLNNEYKLLREQNFKLYVKVEECKQNLQLHKKRLIQQTEELAHTKNEIDEYVELLKELSFEKDQVQNRTKEKYDGLNNAVKYYKTCLDMYVQIERDGVNILHVTFCFFTKKLDESYSVVLSKSEKSIWGLISTRPQILDQQFSALNQRLRETKNISSFICTIRKIFQLMK